MSNHIILNKVAYAKPELRYTSKGEPMLTLRVCDQKRAYNQATSQWENTGDPLWVDVTRFGKDAEHLHALLTTEPKPLVTVVGELQNRSYQTKTGETRDRMQVLAQSVSLHPRANSQQPREWGTPATPVNDPWQQTSRADTPPPF